MSNVTRSPAELGQVLSRHTGRAPAPIGLFLLAMLAAIFGAFILASVPSPWPPAIGLFLLAFGLLVTAVWLYTRSIEIREQGIIYQSLFGVKAWRWEAFDALKYAIYHASYRVEFIPIGGYLIQRYTLSRNNRDLISLTDAYHDGALGGEILMALTAQQFLPDYLKRLQQGETLMFGQRIKVSGTGILQGKKEIPWPAIERIAIQQGFLRITQKSAGTKVIRIQGIPNGHLLPELIDRVLQARASASAP